MNCGYFYCPYIPLLDTPTVLDDEREDVISTDGMEYDPFYDPESVWFNGLEENLIDFDWLTEGF
jgi:hypothetical protein